MVPFIGLSNSAIVLTITFVIIVVIALAKYLSYRSKKIWANTNVKVVNPKGLVWVLWNKTHFGKYEQQLVQDNGRVFGATQLGVPMLYCAEPEMISAVLSKDFTTFINRREFNFGDDEMLTNFLSVVTDDKWKRIRAIVSPTFSSGKLRKMRPMIDDCLQMLLSNFNRLIAVNDELDVKRVFGAFTMNVIIQVAFGTKVDALADADNPIIVNAQKLFSRDMKVTDVPKFALFFTFPKIAKLFGLSVFPIESINFFTELTQKIIDERKSKRVTVKRYDFLQLLLDAMENSDQNDDTLENINDCLDDEPKFVTHNKTLSDTEMIAQCVLFFFAGFETTATTISYATYLLACHPDIQQTLYEEIKFAMQSNSEIDIETLSSLKYLDAVVSETLRLFPPAETLERTANRDYAFDTSKERLRVRKGVVVHIPVYALHRFSEYFPEPDSFRPERFFPENRVHHPYAYLPFGAGPRNCVARRMALMEAKLALMHTVYNFEFQTTGKTRHPPECYSTGGFLVPKNIFLKVLKR